MLNVTTDREPLYIGKPNPAIVSMCMEQVEASPGEVLVVGDRLYTDIACGLNAGVETARCLYRGGQTGRSEGDGISAGLCV